MEYAIEHTVPVTVLYDSTERRITRVIVHDDCLSKPGRVCIGDCAGAELKGKRRKVVLTAVDKFADLWPGWEFGW